MNLSFFDYSFPKELVAQHPLPERDASRMIVVERKKGVWRHDRFRSFADYLHEGDLLILNNAEADLIPMAGRLVPPLPPYIKRRKVEDFSEEDFQRYRTVYAAVPGSKAAPTAGFHFTEEMLEKISSIGVQIRFLTLHVSYDTYKPIRTPKIEDHPIHGEEYQIPQETAEAVTEAKKKGRRVIAIGTTVVRALEAFRLAPAKPDASAQSRGRIPALPRTPIGVTSLYIYPGFRFQIVDALLTNFHRPRSTVLVMVSTFAGRELVLSAYEEAIREKYRLFSYGDCMLII